MSLHYSEIKHEIATMPKTWCPAILLTLVETCIDKQVFLPGKITEFVKEIEDKATLIKLINNPDKPPTP